ncbi:methylamine utilization protein [Marinobacter halotolerans]|uniref:methylamine utilization protein n=1 Tax=Marinobacter halotolerans TaxID=1569211 RepID=UPI001248CDFB|nr:methylamine utilization protein [Marinobacter halotolerans]
MFKNWIVPLLLTMAPLALAAEPTTLSVRIVDSSTGEPVEDARVIINHGQAAEPSSAEMIQKGREFRPHSLVVPRGSKVDFPNRDNTQHHVYSFSPAKSFNIELFAGQPEEPILFDKTGVVEVGCNIHDQMQGFILVTESALTARTGPDGMAAIRLPASVSAMADGKLDFSLWHDRLQNTTQTVDVTASIPSSGPLELALDLKLERPEKGRLDGLQKRFQDL